jgi:hypothetical protein
MATGLGARKTNNDQKYFVNPQMQDNYVSGGVAAGPVLVGMPGAGGGGGRGIPNLDATSMWVWGITLGAVVVVLGVHWSFGGRRLL